VPEDDEPLQSSRQPLDDRKLRARVTICNRKGLHARASAKFVKCAERFDAVVTVTKDERITVGGSSIMSLLMLGAGPGTELVLETEGPEREEALRALVSLVETGFGEE
jgi:phosphocarrier protein HPr